MNRKYSFFNKSDDCVLFALQAIDIWMGACTTFIFGALLEFTLTNYLWRKGTKDTVKGRRRAAGGNGGASPNSGFTTNVNGTQVR